MNRVKKCEFSSCRATFTKNLATGLLLVVLFTAPPGRAVVFYSTNDPAYNTTAPTGALTDSGWQFEGYWASCMGTAIASNFFITAKHVGGSVGGTFLLNGTSYTTTAVYNDPSSDLAIWKVDTAFSAWAPLYTVNVEAGSSLVVFGAGYGRGTEVWADGELKGWQWGGTATKRWGENVVTGTTNYQGSTLLYADFNATNSINEATLAISDSGGGVFIQQNSVWSLAGVNYAVDGPFNTTNTGSGFSAAIFDAGGLYYTNDVTKTWDYITPQATDIPASFYATSTSARQGWIMGIIVPEPATFLLTAVGAGGLFLTTRRRTRRPSVARSNYRSQPCNTP